MSDLIPINLAVEDALSEAVLRRLLRDAHRQFAAGSCFSHHGFGYLRRTIRGFNQAARGTPFLVLTDLDVAECAPALIKEWLPVPKHSNLVFRVAVREVESWLLADREAFAGFARIRRDAVPQRVESVLDPNRCLIDLARAMRQLDTFSPTWARGGRTE